jgi:MFS transporter, PHS family, inorganic phosphate transporter
MFVSGLGFFTDAYDLFVIGIVVSLLKTEWSLSTSQVSWINSATLLASAVGATEALVTASEDADLLVLGIQGRSPFAGLLLGSVSQGAAATASCPVVLVKATDEPR